MNQKTPDCAVEFVECSIIRNFHKYIYKWYFKNQRMFPWRYTYNPYKVLVSEILLQQTNAEKVVQPYNVIVKKYRSVYELADADIVFLKNIFKNLGLFYRADRLINISKQIIKKYEGIIPDKRQDLLSIKGIGNYISSAVLCFGYKKPYAIVDTNVIRVFERLFDFKSANKRPHTDKKVWQFAQAILPLENYVDYNYGLLDFAATVCKSKKPICSNCLMHNICVYSRKNQGYLK